MRIRPWTFLLACIAVSALAAQQRSGDSQQPTFRAGTNYVRVDLYATENGRPVDDLTQGDVELREDGVLQTIDAFEHVRVRTATPEATRVEPNTIAESRQLAADPRARVFVVFLDTYNTTFEGSTRMQQPLMRFIDRVLGPDDLVAVMTPEMSATDLAFGRRTEVISKMLQTTTDWGTRGRMVDMDETEALYDRCFPMQVAAELKARRREKLALDALDDLMTVVGGIREERKAVLTVSEGWMLYRENPALASSNPNALTPPIPPGVFGRVPNAGGDVQAGRAAGGDAARCQSDLLTLSQLNDSERLLQLAQRANRRNVTFYTIDPRGLVVFDSPIGPAPPPPPQQDAAALRTKENGLRFLAENTDGVAVVDTNQIDAAVDRVVADLSSYYLLGYYSTNPKLDGKFRSIKVTVRRPRVQVRARRGYRALLPNEVLVPAAPKSADSGPPVRGPKPLAGVVVDTHAPFLIRTSAWMASAAGTAPSGTFWVVGELERATRKAPEWRRGARAAVGVVAGDGRTVLSKTIDVSASDGAFVLRVPESGSVAPGEYTVRVRVEPQDGAGLPVSDLARVVVHGTSSSVGEPVMWRRGPATGLKYVMTADPRFMRSERLRLEFPAQTSATMMATLLDRSGNATPVPVQISERSDPGSDFHWIVAEVNLSPLAPGDYGVEVSAGDVRQRVEFRVVP